jgi:hypothetical protein
VRRAKPILAGALSLLAAVLIAFPALAAVVTESARTGIGYFTNVVIGGNVQVQSGGAVEVYNTSPIDAANYERVKLDWASNVARLWTQNDGTGSGRVLQVGATITDAATAPQVYTQWNRVTTPHISHVFPGVSATGVLHELFTNSGGISASSGTQTLVAVTPAMAQTGTAGYIALDVNPTESTTGSGSKTLARFAVGGTARLSVTNDGTVIQRTLTVATLPTCNAGYQGGRAFVTDANATTFASAVAGGGANPVPVYCDGAAWRIG